MRTTILDVKQPHWVGHKPNNLREQKNITTFLAPRVKGCVHINEAKKHPSGKLQGAKKESNGPHSPSKEIV